MQYVIGALVLAFVVWMAMTPTLADREIAKRLRKDIEEQEKAERESEEED